MPIPIVILTDYPDVAYNEVRGQIISRTSNLYGMRYWIEPCVHVAPFSVTHCAFLLKLLMDDYTANDVIFVCLVNPAHRQGMAQPERLIVRLQNGQAIFAPDVGIINWALEDHPAKEICALPQVEKMSFAGKYFYPDYIANLVDSSGLSEVHPFTRVERLEPTAVSEGMVVHKDNFGNLKVNVKFETISHLAGHAIYFHFIRDRVIIEEGKVSVTDKRFRNHPTGELVLYEGSSFGLIEIAKVRGFDPLPNVQIGDLLQIKY